MVAEMLAAMRSGMARAMRGVGLSGWRGAATFLVVHLWSIGMGPALAQEGTPIRRCEPRDPAPPGVATVPLYTDRPCGPGMVNVRPERESGTSIGPSVRSKPLADVLHMPKGMTRAPHQAQATQPLVIDKPRVQLSARSDRAREDEIRRMSRQPRSSAQSQRQAVPPRPSPAGDGTSPKGIPSHRSPPG